MWDERLNKQLANILALMADKPALKNDPQDSGRKLFDGGELIVMTGITRYQFRDGSKAIYGTGRDWHLTITLATGDEINLSIPHRYCTECGNILWLGERDCRQCGPETK